MKVNVINLDNKKVKEIDLNPGVFCIKACPSVIKRCVVYQLAKRQSGNHKAKTLSEVSGTGKKPFKQKGTGNARLGSKRAPQCRGGAVIFGPVVRSHEIDLPKKVRKLGLKSVLSSKLSDGKLFIIDQLMVDKISTKIVAEKLNKLGWNSTLFVDSSENNKNFFLSLQNIPKCDLIKEIGINVYDILKHDIIAITENTIKILEERL